MEETFDAHSAAAPQREPALVMACGGGREQLADEAAARL